MEKIQPVDVNKTVIPLRWFNQVTGDHDYTGIFFPICIIWSKEKFFFEKHSFERKKIK